MHLASTILTRQLRRALTGTAASPRRGCAIGWNRNGKSSSNPARRLKDLKRETAMRRRRLANAKNGAAALSEAIAGDVPVDSVERTAEQQARWVLANLLDWHRREEKATWWEFFRLAELSAEDLSEERAALSGLAFIESVGGTTAAPVHRYRFEPQETELEGGESLYSYGGGKVWHFSTD